MARRSLSCKTVETFPRELVAIREGLKQVYAEGELARAHARSARERATVVRGAAQVALRQARVAVAAARKRTTPLVTLRKWRRLPGAPPG